MPADLHDGAGVILCSPERQRLLAQLSACIEAGSCLDGSAESAAETVAHLRASGAERAVLVTTPRDGRAADVLARTCRDAGLPVEFLATGLDGLVHGIELPVAESSRTVLPVDALPLDAATLADWSSHASRRPAVAWIVPPPLTELPAPSRRRSPLPLGVNFDELRAALLRLVAAAFPAAIGRLHAVLSWHDLGMNGIEDQYAGLGLWERNAELLANLVPARRGPA